MACSIKLAGDCPPSLRTCPPLLPIISAIFLNIQYIYIQYICEDLLVTGLSGQGGSKPSPRPNIRQHLGYGAWTRACCGILSRPQLVRLFDPLGILSFNPFWLPYH